MVLVGHGALGRAYRRAKTQPGAVAAYEAVDAGVLDAVEERDLVPRRRLPGQPNVLLVPRAVGDRLLGVVGIVGPFRGIARVLVGPHTGDILPADDVAVRGEEPQLVSDDRTA